MGRDNLRTYFNIADSLVGAVLSFSFPDIYTGRRVYETAKLKIYYIITDTIPALINRAKEGELRKKL